MEQFLQFAMSDKTFNELIIEHKGKSNQKSVPKVRLEKKYQNLLTNAFVGGIFVVSKETKVRFNTNIPKERKSIECVFTDIAE